MTCFRPCKGFLHTKTRPGKGFFHTKTRPGKRFLHTKTRPGKRFLHTKLGLARGFAIQKLGLARGFAIQKLGLARGFSIQKLGLARGFAIQKIQLISVNQNSPCSQYHKTENQCCRSLNKILHWTCNIIHNSLRVLFTGSCSTVFSNRIILVFEWKEHFSWETLKDGMQMSHVMRKPVIYDQQRCWTACASAQSDQHLCCSLPR